jgi:hypothetical protein
MRFKSKRAPKTRDKKRNIYIYIKLESLFLHLVIFSLLLFICTSKVISKA